MLVIAAAIEAFWSSRHEFLPEFRYGVGAFFIVVIAAYFIFAGRRGEAQAGKAGTA
jgi:hypothetical protein